MNENENCPEGL